MGINKSYFDDKGHLDRLVRHQLESYNHFVKRDIEKTITMFNPVCIYSDHDYDKNKNVHTLEVYVTFTNFQIHKPQIHENNGATKLMFPQEARLRNFTYVSNMSVDINIKYVTREGENLDNVQTNYKIIPKIQIGKIPIMVKSELCVLSQLKHIEPIVTGECKYDTGGYFIINGSEKTVLAQERAAQNKIYCFNTLNSTKWSWTAEIKSVPDYKCISPKQINLMISNNNNGFGYGIYIQLPKVKNPITLFIIFRCLNVTSDKDICEKIIQQPLNNKDTIKYLNFLQGSVFDSKDILTYEDAVNYLNTYVMYTPINMEKEMGARKKYEFTLDILEHEIFPHCRSCEERKYFLGYMTLKIIKAYFNELSQDDRDSYINKRIDLTGTLLNNLYRNYFNKLVKDMTKQVIREINTGSWRSNYDYYNIINNTNIYKIIKSTTIENGIKRALSTGDFGVKQSSSSKVGVAQVLNRLTYASSLSHSRRISTPIDKSGKLVPPRMLHSTSWGFVCPVETPEGQSVGVVKNISYMTHITITSDTESVLKNIINNDLTEINNISIDNSYTETKLLLNGSILGLVNNGYKYYKLLKNYKYSGKINIYTSICFDIINNELRVCNDSGRLTRPVLKVRNNKLLITTDIVDKIKKKELLWDDLFLNLKINESVLEYVDAEEQNYSLIAMNEKYLNDRNCNYTHCEIHPSTIFGILASCTVS